MATKILKKVLLVINGDKPKTLPEFSNYDKIICTDGAYHFFVEKNIQPHIILGDFDSFSLKNVPTSVTTIVREDQNFTDFQKALDYILEAGYSTVDVYGATGKESDHYLGNLTVGAKYFKKLNICFFDDYGRSFFANSQIKLVDMNERIVSLYPFPKAINVHSKGLFFHLNGMDLNILEQIGTRNHAVKDKVEITFDSGILLIFISNYTVPLSEKIYSR